MPFFWKIKNSSNKISFPLRYSTWSVCWTKFRITFIVGKVTTYVGVFKNRKLRKIIEFLWLKPPVHVAKNELHGNLWIHGIRVSIAYLCDVWRVVYRLNGILPATSTGYVRLLCYCFDTDQPIDVNAFSTHLRPWAAVLRIASL